MAAPTYADLMEPLFKALHELGGSASIQEQEERVATLMELSDEDLAEFCIRHVTDFIESFHYCGTDDPQAVAVYVFDELSLDMNTIK